MDFTLRKLGALQSERGGVRFSCSCKRSTWLCGETRLGRGECVRRQPASRGQVTLLAGWSLGADRPASSKQAFGSPQWLCGPGTLLPCSVPHVTPL